MNFSAHPVPPEVLRERIISVRVTESGYQKILAHAESRGKNLSDHIRDVLKMTATGVVKIPNEQPPLF